MKNRTKTIAVFGMLMALSLILSYLESLISLPIAFPGIKIGLANLTVLYVLYTDRSWKALLFSLIRVLLASVLFNGFSGIIYSVSGALLSWTIMVLLKRTRVFSEIGVSAAGGLFHNIGQIAAAACITHSPGVLISYLPILAAVGTVMGILNGLIAKQVLAILKKREYKQGKDTKK